MVVKNLFNVNAYFAMGKVEKPWLRDISHVVKQTYRASLIMMHPIPFVLSSLCCAVMHPP